jgi:uncharacterized protein YunC (DUF1805 family)
VNAAPGHRALYDQLGVEPTATQQEIDAAYRTAAKHLHPDAGGSEEEFKRVGTAATVLRDPAARARYDSTGQYGGSAHDDPDAAAYSVALGAFTLHMQQAIQHGREPTHVDLLALVRQQLQGEIQQCEQQVASMRTNVQRMRNVAARVRGAAKLQTMLQAEAANVERAAAAMLAGLQPRHRALELLASASFDVEAAQREPEPDWFLHNVRTQFMFGGGMPPELVQQLREAGVTTEDEESDEDEEDQA